MRHTDLFLITEAQRRADAFEQEVAQAQKLALLPQARGWRYSTANLLLKLAARLEPRLRQPRTTNPC